MVDQQLGVDAEQPVEQIFVRQRAAGNITHGVNAVGLQLSGVAAAHPPEIGKRTVIPQQAAVSAFVQLGNTDAVHVRVDVLCHNIHGHLTEIQVGADPRRGRDTGGLQHIQDDPHGKLPGIAFVRVQVVGHVHQHLVNRIIVDVLGRDVFQVHVVDPGAPLHVMGHPGRSHDVVHRQARVCFQFRIAEGGAAELPPRCGAEPLGVDLLDPLNYLEQPRPAGDAPGFQAGGDRQADGLLRPAQVRHHKVGGQGIEAALNALHGCVEALEINGEIRSLFHSAASFPYIILLLS